MAKPEGPAESMNENPRKNADPITGEPGSHPVGTGVGATGGAVAGAAAGTIGGPAGMVGGTVVGAVVGALAGHAAAEAIDPTAEDKHWRENYDREPYYEKGGSSGLKWDEAQPASRAAWDRLDYSMRGGATGMTGGAAETGRMGGAAAAVGAAQSAGNTSGDHEDVIDVLQDLAECSLDGEYGF